MSAEFTCSDCGKDGTRCDCHKKRQPRIQLTWSQEQAKRLAENERDIILNELELKRFLKKNRVWD